MSNYLYNGIELPALPETHQYAPEGVALDYSVIYKYLGVDTIYLKFIEKPLLAYHETIMDNRLSLRPLPITESYWAYKYELNGNEWEDMGALTNPDYITNDLAAVQGVDPEGRWYQNELMWSNHDIMDSENGGVYFEGSDPVPVGGDPDEPDPDEPDPEQPDEPETVLSWQKHDAYKPNTKWDGNTFYRVMGGKWVKQDAMNPSLIEVEPDVPTEVVIEWDGDTTGKYSVSSPTGTFVKMSDYTPELTDLVGGKVGYGSHELVTPSIDWEQFAVTINEDDITDMRADGVNAIILNEYGLLVCYEDGADLGVGVAFEKGIYFMTTEYGACYYLTYTPKS